MEIENENDDKTETGQSLFILMDFLSKSITINILLLISKLTKIKMKVSDRRKFEKANFDEFESALNNKKRLGTLSLNNFI
ncbi:APG_G0027990.mRNA.1.CDS.1 [Saccharomyces cerevisiae]|nr:APG_G0027990.mRNA.1.CDS.1 [Saccharomyces cerevisiae]CAI7096498.1 APG_G0027990.mRNA.1.CDS.1 [Saccharomyces cerevisiae]